jgi:hypothetical protein
LTALAFTLPIALQLSAHHSIVGVYDTGKEIKLTAVVREFHFVNPHPFITAEVTRSGKVEVWKLEMDNRFELVDIGMTDSTIKPGDRVNLSGSPGREGATALYIRRLDRPADGFWYEQIGFEPRIRGQRR